MSSSLSAITFDCVDADKLATFWSSVLDLPVDAEPSPEFASIGIAQPSASQPGWMFIQVTQATSSAEGVGKRPGQRIHVDLHVGDEGRAAEVERLIGLGAVKLWDGENGPDRWVTMADPEGNAFCLG